ncbi:hypothetical protein [Sediminivirga luteola]|uniref:Uncharacterized protein n=1 Tax=Sediminivirga luteola TaxID=1774748 RepID=A0A8J2U0Y7_9MICO|nr:hypothetical protein [Sediminivirga luteola]MCI2266945.1 hypothetical protein [Sediminivirga luteola]GGA26991.1 hypothetical protein GCM10011333_32260 [Sediminivirga luteola]
MFGLPLSTTLIMSGVIAFWVIYTAVFYFTTSHWAAEDAPEEPRGGEDRR